MKNILKKGLVTLGVSLMLLGCEEKFTTLQPSNYHVKFGTTTTNVTEGVRQIKIPVTLAAPKQSSITDITYGITGTAVEGKDYTIVTSSGKSTIASGSFADTVKINVLNDFDADGAKQLVLTLASATNGLQAGLNAAGKTYTLNIADDDCAFDINDFVGSYDVEITSTAGFGLPSGLYTAETSLKLGTAANTLIDENFWDFGPNSVTITLDPSDPANLVAKLVGAPQQVYVNASALPRFAIQGSRPFGSFNTCETGIVVNMELTRQDGVTVANSSVIRYIKK
jgi:hypothetical protein